MKFYVYEYFKVENNEVFYVGKGTGKRMYELHNRNTYFDNVYNKYDCDVRIVKTKLTNEEACLFEIDRISELKSINQAYCNLTGGGTGFSTGELNPIHKRIEEGSVNLFSSESKFFGEDNGFYGKKHSGETKDKISASRKGKGARFGKDNPMYGKGFKGEENPMFGRLGEAHHNSVMYKVKYLDGNEDKLTAKQCERKFGIAFERIRGIGGSIHYKKKSKNDIYEGVIIEIERVTTSKS